MVFDKPIGGFCGHSMSDFMDEGEGVPMHTPIHSQAHSPIHSHTLQRAANVPTAELVRALMATVGDLALSVAQTNAQQAQTTLHMHGVSDFLAQPREGGGGVGGVQNFMVSRRVLVAQVM